MRAMRDNGEAGGIVAGEDSSARQAREACPIVMAGLDPAIHLLRKKFMRRTMDPRVKPAGDGTGKPRAELGFWVYILANRRGGTLYVGVTNDLVRRAFEHREGLIPGFTKRYGIKMLVYYERHDTAAAAIQREKNIKHWPREWKIDPILSMNPDWRDLYDEIAQ
jgi:putative endonuclease